MEIERAADVRRARRGAVITLMLWLYLSGAAILIGGKVNAEIENAAAERGAEGAKLHGEKVEGEKQEAD